MPAAFAIEIEPEVRTWLSNLPHGDYQRAEFYADLLSDQAETLGEPYSRHLGGKLRELRFYLERRPVRITYWLAPGRRVVLLTVFRKTRRAERAEVDRAGRAQRECEAHHTHAQEVFDRDEFDRDKEDGIL